MVRTLPLFSCLCFLAACVTQNAVRSARPDAGVQGIYRAPLDRVRAAAMEALRESNFALSEDQQKQVLAKGYSASGATLLARIIVEDRGAECVVWVYVASQTPSRENDAADAVVARSIHERLARKLDLPAPPPPLPPAPATDAIERAYASLLTVCFDGALKVCRERGYRVHDDKRTGDHTGTIGAEGKGFTLGVQLNRRADNRTRVLMRVQGRSPAENRDEATRLIEDLRKELKEP